MTSGNQGGDNGNRATQRGNDGNQEARDLGETGQPDDTIGGTAGATGHDGKRNDVTNGNRGVGNNTDGVVGRSGEAVLDPELG